MPTLLLGAGPWWGQREDGPREGFQAWGWLLGLVGGSQAWRGAPGPGGLLGLAFSTSGHGNNFSLCCFKLLTCFYILRTRHMVQP